MILVPRRTGQLCNQLFLIAHFSATAIENDLVFRYPCFEYSLKHFPHLNKLPKISISNASESRNRFRARSYKLLRICASKSPWHHYYLNDGLPFIDTGADSFVDIARRKVAVCEGFGFRDVNNIRKHHESIRALFDLSPNVKDCVDDFVAKNIPSNSIVVGFHVRRRDYKTFCNGQYYFPDSAWQKWIAQCREMIRNQNQRFLGIIFSDEDVSQLVESDDDLVPGTGGVFTDLELMSRCDLIVGPPSTYSGWASFTGQVLIQRMESASTTVEKDKFEIVDW